MCSFVRLANSRLPPELVDFVLDFLHSEYDVLRTCSLVSKGWLPSCRYHLFYLVVLKSLTLPSFLDLAQSSHCTISPYVHTVAMVGSGWWSIDSFISRIAMLGRTAKTLQLIHIPFSRAGSKALSQFRFLTSIELNHTVLQSFEDFALITCASTHLRTIVLNNVKWGSSAFSSQHRMSSAITSLDLGKCTSALAVLKWLGAAETAPLVHTLSLRHLGREDVRAAGDFIREFGSALTHLTIGFDHRLLCGKLDLRL